MEERFRISVRELVAFSYFEPDITQAAGADVMLTGAQAHRGRQAELDGEIEQSIKHVFEIDGIAIQVYGRMDAFWDGKVPLVEEIKLIHTLPETALAEHRFQAICYAAMLAAEKGYDNVKIRICYVDEQGIPLRIFEETCSEKELAHEVESLLRPFVAYALREANHRQVRNASLEKLGFPFASYRKGQRELAAQVYTAIKRKKRLFASLPTGTGKSAAVLYPALKALGNDLTEKIVYLTARNTARQSPVQMLEQMAKAGMKTRCCVLAAREKWCPGYSSCHPAECPRAKGHFVRQKAAIDTLLQEDTMIWDERLIMTCAEKHNVCPFELSLTLSELADVLLMDLNYAFDPFAQLKRLFQRNKRFTLLVDEAHHTVDRVRDNLSGVLDSGELAKIRLEYGKRYGRKNRLYKSLSELIRSLRGLECHRDEQILKESPAEIEGKTRETFEAAVQTSALSVGCIREITRICLSYLYASEHLSENYAVLLERKGKERSITLYCLLPGKEIARITKGLRGTVFFSATLQPIDAMKRLLGGETEDACFTLPSPFPPERLQIVRKKINTRYDYRQKSAENIACIIHELYQVHPGNTLVFFPSYTYLNLVAGFLEPALLPEMWIQRKDMEDEERQAFLAAFDQTKKTRVGLCVLGGLFSEGIDLPGNKLLNVIIVGVGLPVPSVRINAVKECYQQHFGDGFGYACRIPGIQKVLQAAGRVIRSETDKGIVVLIDERYFYKEYSRLLPENWIMDCDEIAEAVERLGGIH